MSFQKIKDLIRQDRLTEDLTQFLESELFYLECNPDVASDLVSKVMEGNKIQNKMNSTVVYLIGLSDEKPTKAITKTEPSLPDIDYDLEPIARDEVKKYLVAKYGREHVALIGTVQTLKTKGAIKDVLRFAEIPAQEANEITKTWDFFNRPDFDTELDFFEAGLASNQNTLNFFKKRPDLKDAVIACLGAARGTGIHAGGIVVSREPITNVCPCVWDEDEEMFVTQIEMAYVEQSGLIKYDFLGLNTLSDLNETLKLIEAKHGVKIKLSSIPKEDEDVFDEFKMCRTESIFQFNTVTAMGLLRRLNSVRSIGDLAAITSLGRPGPLNMKMDDSFISRANGETDVVYDHDMLESTLKDTHGVIVFQEQVMKIAVELANFDGAESAHLIKAISKKIQAKVDAYKARFIEGCSKNGIEKKISERIWDQIESFATYAFNKSHAVAYATTSYYSMWLKKRYPLEWTGGVLKNATDEDFKALYPKWKEFISPPDINQSKLVYTVSQDGKLVMPLTTIRGLGDVAAKMIVAKQPFESVEDFIAKITPEPTKRAKIDLFDVAAKTEKGPTKKDIVNLIVSGCFDSTASSGMGSISFRKHAVELALASRHKIKKPTKAEAEADRDTIVFYNKLNRDEFLIKEISLLNFSGFDYFRYFEDRFKKIANGQQILTPAECSKRRDGDLVIVAGAISAIKIISIKNGKSAGKQMMKITLSHNGAEIDVTVFSNALESDEKNGNVLRRLKEFYPFVVRGRINVYNEAKGVILEQGVLPIKLENF